MKLNGEKKGEVLVLSAALLGALFPVITILSYNTLSPLVSFAGSTFFASILFAIVLTARKKWHELKNIHAYKDLLMTTLIIGIIFYLLYFFGLRQTSAGNASIIALSEVFFGYLFFQVYKKDYLPNLHKLGAVLMVIGALIVLFPKMQNFTGGELLILLAAMIAPIGNFYQQRARKRISSESIMFTRSIISTIFIVFLAIIFKSPLSYPDIKSSIIILLINGVFLFGLSKILWVEGIHRISVTKANALSSISPLFTIFFAWILLQNTPTIWQLLAIIPMSLGVIFLGKPGKSKN